MSTEPLKRIMWRLREKYPNHIYKTNRVKWAIYEEAGMVCMEVWDSVVSVVTSLSTTELYVILYYVPIASITLNSY